MDFPTDAEVLVAERKLGERLVKGIAVVWVLASLLVTTIYVIRIGPDRLPQQGFRLLLTVFLGVKLYQREGWARVLLTTFGALGGGASLLAGLGAAELLVSVQMLVLAGVYLGSTALLLFSPPVKRYLEVGPDGPRASG